MDCINRFSDYVYLKHQKGEQAEIAKVNKSLFINYVFEKNDTEAEKLFENIVNEFFKENEKIFADRNEAKEFLKTKFKNVLALRQNISNANFNDYEKLFAIANLFFLTGTTFNQESFADQTYVEEIILEFINNLTQKSGIENIFNQNAAFLEEIKNNAGKISNLLSYSFVFDNKKEENVTKYYKSYNNYQDLIRRIAQEEVAIKEQNSNASIRSLLLSMYTKDTVAFLTNLVPQEKQSYASKYEHIATSYGSFFATPTKFLDADVNTANKNISAKASGFINEYIDGFSDEAKQKVADKITELNKGNFSFITYGKVKNVVEINIKGVENAKMQEAEIPVANPQDNTNKVVAEDLSDSIKEMAGVLNGMNNLLTEIRDILKLKTVADQASTSVLSSLVDSLATQISQAIANNNASDIDADDAQEQIEQAKQEISQNVIADNENADSTAKTQIDNKLQQLSKSLETYKGLTQPIIVGEDDPELKLSENKKYYEYKSLQYQRYTDVIGHYFDFDSQRPVARVRSFMEKISEGDKTASEQLMSKLNVLFDLYNIEDDEVADAFRNSTRAAMMALQGQGTIVETLLEDVLKEYQNALLEKRNFSIDSILDKDRSPKISVDELKFEKLTEAIQHIAQTQIEQQNLVDETKKLFLPFFTDAVRYMFRTYEYYTQRATLGRMTERIIQEKVNEHYETDKKIEQQVTGIDAFASITEDELESLMKSYSESVDFFSMYSIIEEFKQSDDYKNVTTPFNKLTALFNFLEQKKKEYQAIKAQQTQTGTEAKQVEGMLVVDKTPQEKAEMMIERIDDYKKKLTDTLNVLSAQYNEFSKAIIRKTDEALELWEKENKKKKWNEVLLFNKKILNRVVYNVSDSYVEEARLAGTPDVMIVMPKNKYTIYELKSYINKDKDYKPKISKTAKVGGYSLEDKAKYQAASYVSLLRGRLVDIVGENINASVVFFGNRKDDEKDDEFFGAPIITDLPKKAKLFNLFQRKILTNGIETFYLSEREIGDESEQIYNEGLRISLAIKRPKTNKKGDFVKDKNGNPVLEPPMNAVELSNIKEKLNMGNGNLIIDDKPDTYKTLYDKDIEGYALYYLPSDEENPKKVFVGVIKTNKEENIKALREEFNKGEYASVSFGYSGARYLLKDTGEKKQANDHMPIQDFMEALLTNVEQLYGVDKTKLELETVALNDYDVMVDSGEGKAILDKDENEVLVYYNDNGNKILLAKQRVYKPKMVSDGESTQKLLNAIKTIKEVKGMFDANVTIPQILKGEKKPKDGNDYNKEKQREFKNAINLVKAFVLNNLSVLNGMKGEKEKLEDKGIILKYGKKDYYINLIFDDQNKPQKWEDFILAAFPKDQNGNISKGKNLPFYEYENWFIAIEDKGEKKIEYNPNGLVRVSEFERKNTKLSLIPSDIRIVIDEKKKIKIDKIKRLREEQRYVIQKGKEILDNFVRLTERDKRTKIIPIYKERIHVASDAITQVPNYIVEVMDRIRKSFNLKDEDFGAFQDNLAQMIFLLESLVYETRFGYTQRDGFVNRPSDIKKFDGIFDLVTKEMIGQVDTWALSYVESMGNKFDEMKDELDILKETLRTLIEVRKSYAIAIKGKSKTDTQPADKTQELEDEETEQTYSDENTGITENIEESDDDASQSEGEDVGEISTQQSIILGASSMNMEKNVNKIIKNVIRYTTIKSEYEIKYQGTKGQVTTTIQTGRLEGRYIDFNVIYNSLPNFGGKRYYKKDGRLYNYYYPPKNIKDLADNIKSYLVAMQDKSENDFYLMLLAVYDKLFSEDNPNSLLSKAKENKDWEFLANGMFNAFGSFAKTKYFVSNAKTGYLDIRNFTSTTKYIQLAVKGLSEGATISDITDEKDKESITEEKVINKLKVLTGKSPSIVKIIYNTAKRLLLNANEKPTPLNILQELVTNKKFNESVQNAISEVEDVTDSSMFKTLDGQTRSDIGLRSTTIDDLQLLETIYMYSAHKNRIDETTASKIKSLQDTPCYKYNELVQNGIVEYGDYLGIVSKDGNVEYGKMDTEDIYYRFYLNVFKPLSELAENQNASRTIHINSFVSSNKKISFQAGVNHKLRKDDVGKSFYIKDLTEKNGYDEILADKLYMRFMGELKARETLMKKQTKDEDKRRFFDINQTQADVAFEFLAYTDMSNKKHTLKLKVQNKNGVLEFAEKKEDIDKKIKEHFKKLVDEQIEKTKGLLSGKYKKMEDMVKDTDIFALSTALYRVYKWDLDTYLYGYANMEYKGIDKANKRASIHTSVKYKLNADTAFGIGNTFPVARLNTPEKAMPELMMLGYADEKKETNYKPFDGSAFLNPVFSELFARATGKNLGFGLTQEGSHKPVAMWRDRETLTNISMKFASFDMFLKQIDTDAFFDMKKLLARMLSRRVFSETKFYKGLTEKERNAVNDAKTNLTDQLLLDIPFHKLNISLIADYYQAYNHFNTLSKNNEGLLVTTEQNPYSENDIRHKVFNDLATQNASSDLFSDIIAMVGDSEAFKNTAPESIEFYDEKTGKVKSVNDIVNAPLERTGNKRKIIDYPTEYFGFQLNPHHEVDKTTETPLATQLLYLISLYSTKNNRDDFNKKAAKEIYSLLQEYIKDVKIMDIVPYFVEGADGKIEIDYVKFYEKVYAKSNADPTEMQLFLSVVKENGNPFAIPGIANKLISNLSSLVQNHIIRLKTLGTDFVLVPDFYTKKTIYGENEEGKTEMRLTSLKWHNLSYKVEKDIKITLSNGEKFEAKKDEIINVSEWDAEVREKLAALVKEGYLELESVGKCDLAMPVLDKEVLKKFIEFAKGINKYIKDNNIKTAPLPEFDVYGYKGKLDNPSLFLDLVKEKLNELKETVKDKGLDSPLDDTENIIERFDRMISPLGVRIPTTSKGNAIAGRVVKFLDTESNVVIFPSEIVKIHGSDYDVDKIKLFFKNYLDEKYLSEKDKEQHYITDQMIEKMEQILLHTENVYELFTDIDFANAKNNIEIYEEALNTELVAQSVPYATLDGDAKLQTENMTNVYLVGIFATTAKFFTYASLAGLKIISKAGHLGFNLDLPEREQFIYKVEDGEFKKIKTENNATYTKYVYSINALSIATNAAIDAVKEQIHGAIGNNLFNARLYAFLLTQRNSFVASSLFMSPFTYYSINYSFNKKKKNDVKGFFNAVYPSGKESEIFKTHKKAYLLVEGDKATEEERGVIADETMYELLKNGYNKDEIDKFFAAMETLGLTNDPKQNNREEVRSAIANFLKVEPTLDKENLLKALRHFKSSDVKKKKEQPDEKSTETVSAELSPELVAQKEKAIETIVAFCEKFVKPIEVKFIKQDGSINEKATIISRIGDLSHALLEEYNDMVGTINKELMKASAVFGINQGYQRDLETNMERYEKAKALSNNDNFVNIEYLFKDDHAGFFMTYHEKLMEGIRSISNITVQASVPYLSRYNTYLSNTAYDVTERQKAPFTYKRGFYRLINRIMLSPNAEITLMSTRYDFTKDEDAGKFISTFPTKFKGMDTTNIFLSPLTSIVFSDKVMRLNFSAYDTMLSTQNIIHSIYDKMTDAEGNPDPKNAFFEQLSPTELALLKTHFGYKSPDTSVENYEEVLKATNEKWETETYDKLTKQLEQANDMYHALFLYESITNAGKAQRSVINVLPTSVIAKIYSLMGEKQKEINTFFDEDLDVIFNRELYLSGLKPKSMLYLTDLEEKDNPAPVIQKTENGQHIIVTKMNLPYAFKYTEIESANPEEATYYTFVRLTPSEANQYFGEPILQQPTQEQQKDTEKKPIPKKTHYYIAVKRTPQKQNKSEEEIVYPYKKPFFLENNNMELAYLADTNMAKTFSLSDEISAIFGKVKKC